MADKADEADSGASETGTSTTLGGENTFPLAKSLPQMKQNTTDWETQMHSYFNTSCHEVNANTPYVVAKVKVTPEMLQYLVSSFL